MVELSRKQREMERRTQEILRVAKPILVREGFHALSMDRVAAAMEYAKGTIYNHFPHKEEIVLALAIESMALRRKLFHAAAALDAPNRVRLMAIGCACEFYTQHCSEDFAIEQWIRNVNVWDKSSAARQDLIRRCEGECMSIVSSVVHSGVASGELVLNQALTAEEFVFGFWAITFGSQILTASSPSLAAVGILDPRRAIRIHCCTLLNGYRWQPIMETDEYLTRVDELSTSIQSEFDRVRVEHYTT